MSSLVSLGPGLAENLVDVFARTTPALLDDLRAAVDRDDGEARHALAHKLRGSAETVGAQRLSELARQLELHEDADAAIAQLEPVYRDTLDALQRLAARSAPRPARR
jgi:HPt (histidine-containing phosphotransfer) domain-containing protein